MRGFWHRTIKKTKFKRVLLGLWSSFRSPHNADSRRVTAGEKDDAHVRFRLTSSMAEISGRVPSRINLWWENELDASGDPGLGLDWRRKDSPAPRAAMFR